MIEVQRRRDRRKRFTLPIYQALARARHGVPCDVLVIATTARTAAWHRAPIALGSGSVFRAIVVGPEELRLPRELATPEVAFLRAVANGDREPRLVLDAARILDRLDETRGALYFDVILAALSEATRQFVEGLMQIDELEFESDFMRNLVKKGREQGREEGLRAAIRAVLAARALAPTADQVRQLEACRDPGVLGMWLERAAVAHAADDVFSDGARDR